MTEAGDEVASGSAGLHDGDGDADGRDDDRSSHAAASSSSSTSDPVVVSFMRSGSGPVGDGDDDDAAEHAEVFLDAQSHDDSFTRELVSYHKSSLLSHKAPLTSVARWLDLSVTSLDGRDKLTKVVQYSAKLWAWWARSTRFQNLAKSLSTSRKAYRLGRSLIEMQKLQTLAWSTQFLSANKRRNKEPNGMPKMASASYGSERDISEFDGDVSGNGSSEPSEKRRSCSSVSRPKSDWLKSTATLAKTVGTVIYYLFDNLDFVSSAGLLDQLNLSEKHQMLLRKRKQAWYAKRANQAEIVACIAGLYLNVIDYIEFRRRDVASEAVASEKSPAAVFRVLKEKQLALLLSVTKSVCDVVVFANSTGIDWFLKVRGRKNHEAIHCFCGLISAGAALLKQYPNSD